MRERGCSPTTTPAQRRRPYRSRHPYAVSKTSLRCVCIQRRNCIEQSSPSPKYAPGNAHFPVGTMPQSGVLSEMTPRPFSHRARKKLGKCADWAAMADRDSDQRADCEASVGASEARSHRLTEAATEKNPPERFAEPHPPLDQRCLHQSPSRQPTHHRANSLFHGFSNRKTQPASR